MGSLQLQNRVVMAPLTRARAGISRMPNDFMRQYYEMRGSAGLIITEATAITEKGYGWFGAPGLYTHEHAEAWKSIVAATQAKGAKIFIQLWHMGRQAHSSFNVDKEIVAPSAIAVPGEAHTRDANREAVPYETPRALTVEEISQVVQDFKRGAKLAKEAGFDGVEIHGANGYLIDTFLQSSSNVRTDNYGGSFENRYRILKEIVEAVGEVYDFDRIGIRFSPNGVYGGMGSIDNDFIFEYVAAQLSNYGLAYLHVMDGLNFGFHNLCRPVTCFDIKKNFNGPVIGNITYTKDTAEGAIRSGAADLIAFGRPYITNPDLVERFANNWPLNPDPQYSDWYGTTPDAKDCLEGYTTYLPYNPEASK
jgi:N-ethylmaleimide reductase